MAAVNYGICEKCRKPVPATHVIRDGRVYIVKNCPDCGKSEALISTNAAVWRRKREVWHFDPDAIGECRLNCLTCGYQHKPRMVFLDVTNRCNMNCPICIANIPGMGFEFNPPLEYFERVLDGLAAMEVKPFVNLFGGEPTVRDDLFQIIKMARDRKLSVGVVTNGLRLADAEYCRKICDSKARVLLGFDGRAPEIYERLRKNPSAYEKKLQALENLKKFSKRRHTIMCCVARHINDKHMQDLVEFCHANRDYIQFLHLIPLTETWEEGEFETDVTTTVEDVEQIIDEAFPEDKVEFLPAGLGPRCGSAGSIPTASRPRSCFLTANATGRRATASSARLTRLSRRVSAGRRPSTPSSASWTQAAGSSAGGAGCWCSGRSRACSCARPGWAGCSRATRTCRSCGSWPAC